MEIQLILKEFGLSEKETGVYLASLSLGVASVTQLSKKAGLKRPTTYLVVDNLIHRGLLVSVPRGKKIYYKPENPEVLLKTLEERKIKIVGALDILKGLYRHGFKQPKIRFYEGREKIYKIYEEVPRSKEIWAIFSPDSFMKVFTIEDNKHFFRILNRNEGVIHDILEDTSISREFAKADYKMGVSESKFLPKGIKIGTDVLVSGDKVAMISFENQIGVIIEDKNIAKTIKTALQLLWQFLA